MRIQSIVLLGLLLACGQQAPDASANPPAERAPAAATGSGTPQRAVSDDQVVATWQGGKLTYGELKSQISSQIVQMDIEYLTNRYQAESSTLDQFVVQKLLEEEAASQGLADVDALLDREVRTRVSDPTEAEIQEFYLVVQRQLRGAPLEMVRDRLTEEVRRRKEGEVFSTWVEALRTRKGVETILPYPYMPRIAVSTDDDPSIGPVEAPVTIIQFAEYQCPYCGKAATTLDEVMEAYPGKVRMVFRDFPLGFHDRAIPAAVAANCAEQQGKYWEMHRMLMADQSELDDATLEAHARKAALDIDKWQTCRKDPAMEAEVTKDMADGSAAGVSGTPAFFINGIMLSGALPFSEFKAVIDRELGF